jgi:hypothetical protein
VDFAIPWANFAVSFFDGRSRAFNRKGREEEPLRTLRTSGNTLSDDTFALTVIV